MMIAAALENSGTAGVVVGWGVGEAVGVAVCTGVGVGVGVGVAVGVVLTQFQVSVEGAVIANAVADDVPEAGTLPVPDQPEQAYPEAGDETNAVILVLLSYQALVGEGESYVEVTVK